MSSAVLMLQRTRVTNMVIKTYIGKKRLTERSASIDYNFQWGCLGFCQSPCPVHNHWPGSLPWLRRTY